MSTALWLRNLAAWSVQATVLIAAGSLAVGAFRIQMPRVRLVFGQVLLAICLLLPVGQTCVPRLEITVSRNGVSVHSRCISSASTIGASTEST